MPARQPTVTKVANKMPAVTLKPRETEVAVKQSAKVKKVEKPVRIDDLNRVTDTAAFNAWIKSVGTKAVEVGSEWQVTYCTGLVDNCPPNGVLLTYRALDLGHPPMRPKLHTRFAEANDSFMATLANITNKSRYDFQFIPLVNTKDSDNRETAISAAVDRARYAADTFSVLETLLVDGKAVSDQLLNAASVEGLDNVSTFAIMVRPAKTHILVAEMTDGEIAVARKQREVVALARKLHNKNQSLFRDKLAEAGTITKGTQLEKEVKALLAEIKRFDGRGDYVIKSRQEGVTVAELNGILARMEAADKFINDLGSLDKPKPSFVKVEVLLEKAEKNG